MEIEETENVNYVNTKYCAQTNIVDQNFFVQYDTFLI